MVGDDWDLEENGLATLRAGCSFSLFDVIKAGSVYL